jgi:nitroimidazol reductase NimA-like FMN-containing flavoprotein (pyridoxamine 5'-phosphate oxidase superfamily)
MISPEHAMKDRLRLLLESQQFAVLATHTAGQPYASLVAFAASADMATLYFATNRATRKYANVSSDPRVALLIDDRSNTAADVQAAVAATATGVCREAGAGEREAALLLYLAKHPHLEGFVRAPDCALLRVNVEAYCLVDRFQHVVAWRVGSDAP